MTSINFEEFSKIDLRIGRVEKADFVESSEKLIKLEVSFGHLGKRNIFAGIRRWYTPADLIGNLYIFVFNLEPKKMIGSESQGMILAAEDENEENCVLLIPDKNIPPGTKVH
jgi:methionine--tRNA ligase beta chain